VGHPASHSRRPEGPEVADILRDHAYGLSLTHEQVRVVHAIASCRTAALGGHVERCKVCGYERNAYNSCRNRHCPKCQILKQEVWAERQEGRLLPVPYFHVVFTIAAELHALFRCAPKVALSLLFEAVAETLSEVAGRRLKGEIGFTAILHTWSQLLLFHPHIHCIVPGGALGLSGFSTLRPGFFLYVPHLRRVFKAKLMEKLKAALRSRAIDYPEAEALALIRRAARKRWGVKVKPPLAGPKQVVRYLSRYVHRVALANSRIVAYDGERVRFRYKDRQDGNKIKVKDVSGQRFARLFLQHVLPERFVRIRHYGLLAARAGEKLARCRRLLRVPEPTPRPKESWVETYVRIFHRDPLLCPRCKRGQMVARVVLRPLRL
jgi:predicted Zn-ribbon and HTH transcriptional regulator